MLKPEDIASSVYPLPALSMEISLKVATPLTAATVSVPHKEPPPGLLLIVNVMESVAVVTGFPKASSTWTWVAGEMDVVDSTFVGSTL